MHSNKLTHKIMTKSLLTAGLLVFGTFVFAQNTKSYSLNQNDIQIGGLPKSEAFAKPNAQTCDSIYTAPWTSPTTTLLARTASTDTSTPGCSPLAGYVNGTNCYGDKEKANFNAGTLYGSLSNASVTAVKVLLYRNASIGRGTQGAASANIGLKLYGGNNTSGPSGSALVTKNDAMTAVLASHTNTSINVFWHTINLLTPVQVPSSGFFASIVIPTGTPAGDTAVIVDQFQASPGIGWEYWSDNTWHKYNTPGTWQFDCNMAIVPYYCFTTSGVGLSKNLGIEESVQIFPNPSNGNLKLQTSFISPENLNITITNALGQQVKSFNKSAMIDIIEVDLGAQPDGIYFVTVSNGKDKMVQRIILNK